jgi:hypothetical protein
MAVGPHPVSYPVGIVASYHNSEAASAEVDNAWSFISMTPIPFHCMVLRYRGSFLFALQRVRCVSAFSILNM